ncbi:hypothetical protein EUX98_g8378 [Antrodiella citrinella]|uniref:Uncharacterized protein n=1 Tax=Antrodiella citrinella TaxID=2447956 RepID=A0A4S4M8J2_9APHY|nr:hypothetical protein EUX98_g8378 [Antrodiella citrinella]
MQPTTPRQSVQSVAVVAPPVRVLITTNIHYGGTDEHTPVSAGEDDNVGSQLLGAPVSLQRVPTSTELIVAQHAAAVHDPPPRASRSPSGAPPPPPPPPALPPPSHSPARSLQAPRNHKFSFVAPLAPRNQPTQRSRASPSPMRSSKHHGRKRAASNTHPASEQRSRRARHSQNQFRQRAQLPDVGSLPSEDDSYGPFNPALTGSRRLPTIKGQAHHTPDPPSDDKEEVPVYQNVPSTVAANAFRFTATPAPGLLDSPVDGSTPTPPLPDTEYPDSEDGHLWSKSDADETPPDSEEELRPDDFFTDYVGYKRRMAMGSTSQPVKPSRQVNPAPRLAASQKGKSKA